MISDARIDEARKAGEKNKQTLELVQNWCAHIRVRAEGVGMLAQATGLPIGHHSLNCEHAPAGGMSAWDMADVALHFYDQNCANCPVRKPVGIPNLSQLVAARDERRRQRQRAQDRAEQEERDKHAAREQARNSLRQGLDPIAIATVDLISDLDTLRTKEAADKLVATATLAPESFGAGVIDHLFWLLLDSGEYALHEPALRTLAKLPVAPARLCNAAFKSFHGARDTAVRIIEEHGGLADEELIAPALPGLISIACPERFPFGGEPAEPVTEPLRALYRARPASVRAGLKILLGRTEAHNARLAAQGIRVLAKDDASMLEFGIDELMAKVARAKWIAQGREDEVDKALAVVRKTLVKAFHANPTRVDKTVNDFLHGASEEGRVELFKLYQDVLRGMRRSDEKITLTDAHRIAFRRLVVEAIKDENDNSDISYGVFHGDPYELTPLALEEIDLLLGSAAIIADKLDVLNSTPLDQKNPVAGWERMGARSKLSSLLDAFVRWACVAAGNAGSDAINKVLAVLHGLPEGSTRMAATIVGNFPKLAKTVEGLQLILPDYYAALVGASQLVRSDAATALGEMPRIAQQNMPSLVFEAFTALMSDPYMIVHRAAVRALERFSLPEEFRAIAMRALSQWIIYYSENRTPDGDRFLVEAVDLYAYRYASDEKLKGRLGDRLLEILTLLPPDVVMQESRRGVPALEGNPNYPQFFLRLLADEKTMATHHEDLLEHLQSKPVMNLYAVRKEAVEVGKWVAAQYPWGTASFIEALTSCGAWAEAAELTGAVIDAIPDTLHYRARKLHFALWRIACDYEAAIAQGQFEKLNALHVEWDKARMAIKEDNEQTERKRVPLSGLFGQD